MFVSKILASDLKVAILDMNYLLGISVVELLVKQLETYGILSEDNSSKAYTFEEINDVLTIIFGEATPLFMLQMEKRIQNKK